MAASTIGKCMQTIGKKLALDSRIMLSSGYEMPLFGIGTSLIYDKQVMETTLTTAIDAGYRMIDTAWSYGNQKLVGEVLNKIIDSGRVKRQDLFIIDKVPNNGMEDAERFLLKSSMDLKLDYVDLYLIHSPIATKHSGKDEEVFPVKDGELMTHHVNLSQTWNGMELMVNMGYALSVGLSNFNSEQVGWMHKFGMIKPANIQVECHAYLPQNELQAFCDELGISFTAFGPVGNPNFPKFAREVMGMDYPDAPVLLEDRKLNELAEKYNKNSAQVALRYLLQRGIAVIPKSTNPERIKSNIDVFDFALDEEDMKAIESIENRFRYYKMNYFKGMEDHPEYPFNIPF